MTLSSGSETNRLSESVRAARLFADRFGVAPTLTAYSPGRVNLIGEHTDYNDGFVMPFAIDRGVCMAIGPKEGGEAEIWTEFDPAGLARFSLNAPVANGPPAWSSYVRGVAQGLLAAGVPLSGFRAVLVGDLPTGGGLSSSAAVEISTCLALLALAGREMAPLQMALLCQQAEHAYAGTPCGIMDQFAVTFSEAGNVLLLDCRSREQKLVPVAPGAPAFLIVNSMVKHALNDGGYKARRDACFAAAAKLEKFALRDATLAEVETLADDVLRRRARHVVAENRRCQDAADALVAGNWSALGSLLYSSHASLRDDFNVSCAELDCIVETARSIGEQGGVYGCRMTGGGFGGCCVALVRQERLAEVTESIATTYQDRTGIRPVAFSTRPSAGAQIIPIQ